jgi:predicted nucleotidyltransferase
MPQDERATLIGTLSRALRARLEVLEAYLFGSQARGDAGPHSDVDVAVYVDPAVIDRPSSEYAAELTSALMTALGRNDLDIVLLNAAPPLLYHRVLRDGVRLLSRDPPATTTREGRALSRHCDYVPQLRKIDMAHAARIRHGEFGR